jgi:hypothetical protein
VSANLGDGEHRGPPVSGLCLAEPVVNQNWAIDVDIRNDGDGDFISCRQSDGTDQLRIKISNHVVKVLGNLAQELIGKRGVARSALRGCRRIWATNGRESWILIPIRAKEDENL